MFGIVAVIILAVIAFVAVILAITILPARAAIKLSQNSSRFQWISFILLPAPVLSVVALDGFLGSTSYRTYFVDWLLYSKFPFVPIALGQMFLLLVIILIYQARGATRTFPILRKPANLAALVFVFGAIITVGWLKAWVPDSYITIYDAIHDDDKETFEKRLRFSLYGANSSKLFPRPNSRAMMLQSPLSRAIIYDRMDMVERLIDKGVSLNRIPNSSHENTFDSLFINYPSGELGLKDGERLKHAQTLLAAGSDPDIALDSIAHEHRALNTEETVAIIEEIIAAGANPDIGFDEANWLFKSVLSPYVDRDGTLSIRPLSEHDIAIMRRLLQAGANPNYEGKVYPPVLAYTYCSPEAIDLLIEFGVDINTPVIRSELQHNAPRLTLLEYAVSQGDTKMIDFLIERGAR